MKQFYAFCFFAISSYGSSAQVIYTNVTPARVLDGSTSGNNIDSVQLHPAHPLTPVLGKDSTLMIWHFNATAPASKDVGVDCRGTSIELLKLSSSLVPTQFAAIDSGVMIDQNAGTWQRPNYMRLNIQGAMDNWDSKTDKYLGIRFMRSGKWYYGWIKMSVDATPTKAEIKGYAYEATAEKGIVAGYKGTTGISETPAGRVHAVAYDGILFFMGVQQHYNVTVWNTNGQIVTHTEIDEQHKVVDMRQMQQGIYIVKIQSGPDVCIQKLML